MIKITGCKSGGTNNAPTITNLKCIKKEQDSATIKYHVEDAENQIVRHYLLINDGIKNDRKEITSIVGYNKNDFEYNITSLKSGNIYTIQIEVSDGNNLTKSNPLQITMDKNYIYGIRIDTSNSNPKTSVTYLDDATGIQVANSNSYGGWKDKWPFNKIRPVGFKNGSVHKEINENDFTKYIDGESVLDDVDVMIEIPKIYWKIERISNFIDIRISKDKADDNFVCHAHTIGTREVNNIYIGCYQGLDIEGKLRSIKKDVESLGKQTLSQFRVLAQANGTGYQQMCYYPNTLLQILYLIMYKNLDSQSALGKGYSDIANTDELLIGGTYNKGMIYGDQTGKTQMKFLGVEDWWGNKYDFIDGIRTNSIGDLLISDQSNFNDNGDGYENLGLYASTKEKGYSTDIKGDNKGAFLPLNINGSSSTYYCDEIRKYQGRIMRFGGDYIGGTEDGAFAWQMNVKETSSYTNYSGRLIYLG